MTKRTPFLAGLFLICMSTLMLQVIQTRILSVVSMYYLVFLSISMAMLGMTAGALFVYFRLREITPATVTSYLSQVSTVFALTILLCFVLQLASPMAIIRVATTLVMWSKVLVLLAAPFAVAGVAVSLALTRSPFPIGITYGVDLTGAACGCLAVLFLLNIVDASSAIFVVAALAALAGLCFRVAADRTVVEESSSHWRLQRRPGIIALGLLALAVANATTRYGLQPISAKFDVLVAGTAYDFEKWNSFSRILGTRTQKREPFLWGPSPTLPSGIKVEHYALNIDGFAATLTPRFPDDIANVDFLKYDITNLAYAARPTGRVAIIGVGSGRDLLSAYVFGARDITGIELNPIFIDLLTDPAKQRDYLGVANLPGVRLVVDEGRSWFARTTEKFDLVQMSMIDTFAATGAGAFSLSENGLYTVEAWRIFLSTLTPTGLFTVSRWHAPSAPIEMGRTTSLAVAALFSLGIQNPGDHIFLASSDNLATLVIARSPLSSDDLRILSDTVRRLQFKVLARPGAIASEPVFHDLLTAVSAEALTQTASRQWLDMSAPTDARPFFFNQLRLLDRETLKLFVELFTTFSIGRLPSDGGEAFVVLGNLIAMSTLLMLIFMSLVAVIVVIIVPARAAIRNVERRLVYLGSLYFLMIGLGFMFIEIGLIQRMSVVLGHPVYALGVVLFSIILSTGMGSLLSERFMPSSRHSIVLWLSLLVIYVLGLPYWLPELTHSLESSPLTIRCLVTVMVILPAGVLMGFGFPFGMSVVMKRDGRPTPWFWAINGAGGVFAAGLAVAWSITFSIDATLRFGGICYLILLPTALLLSSPGPNEEMLLARHAEVELR
jgi:hypothetical protein